MIFIRNKYFLAVTAKCTRWHHQFSYQSYNKTLVKPLNKQLTGMSRGFVWQTDQFIQASLYRPPSPHILFPPHLHLAHHQNMKLCQIFCLIFPPKILEHHLSLKFIFFFINLIFNINFLGIMVFSV